MNLLAIDPSSTRCGFAVMTESRTLTAFGAVQVPPWPSKALAVRAVAREMVRLATHHRCEHAVVEIPAPQAPGFKSNRGQATYGMAVGLVLGPMYDLLGDKGVTDVASDIWTRQVKKELRQKWIAQQFPQYRIERDAGGDMSDAIALAEWWFTERLKGGDQPIGQRPTRKPKPRAVKAKIGLWA